MENLELCSITTVNWRLFCSKVTEKWLHSQDPIDGNSIEVELDEILLVHQKYRRGSNSEPSLIDGIDQTSKRCFVVSLVNNKATLVPLIQAYIKPGSGIYSDSWAAYNELSSLG
uniref:Uncharacterized protein n=1 Tax=Octopus bimaculoides TaxID=37653 RepID=A0A0L8HG56_OCTBM